MIYVLDSDLNVLSLLVNAGPESCPYFDDLMKETIADGALTYEFTTLGTHEAASHLSSTGYVMRANLRGELLLFKIRSIQETKQADGRIYKTVFTENAGLELIHDIVRPTYLYFATPAAALTNVLQGTEWQPGVVEWLGQENYEFTSYPTVLSAIQEINSKAGGEIVFRVEMENGRVTGKYIDLLQKRGQAGTFRFDYRHDLQEVERVEDASFLVTALIGIGEKAEGGQNPITMVGVDFTGTLPDGTKVYKSPNQDYVENPQALQRYGRRGRHLIGVFKTEETDRLALIKRTWAELMTYSEPQLQYTVKVAVLSRLAGVEFNHKNYELGDGGDVIDHSFTPSLMVSARIIERETSFTDPSRDTVTLGNFIRYQPTALEIIERLQDTIREQAPIWTGTGELIHKGAAPPSAPKDLDLWLDTSQEPHILKKYDAAAGRWINASPTEPGDIGAIPPEYADDVAREEGDRAEENAKDYAKDLVDRSEAATRDFMQVHFQTNIKQQKTAPSNPNENDLWIDVSKTPHIWKRWTGTEWVNATTTSLTELAGQLKSAQIERGAVTEDLLAAAAITEEKIKDGAVGSYKIALGAVIGNRLADRAVSEAKLATGAVTPMKISNGAITSEKLADLAVEAAKLADSAVTAEKIANAAIGTAAIQDAAITNAKIAEIDAGKITTGRLDAGRVQIGAGTQFAAGYDPTAIEIGGRNLAQRTNETAWSSYYSSDIFFLMGNDGRRSIMVFYIGGDIWGIQQTGAGRTMKLEQGKQYTLSFDVRGTPGLPMNYVYIMNTDAGNELVEMRGEPLSDRAFTRYTGTFTKKFVAKNSYIMISNRGNGGQDAFFEVKNIKVEAGNKATDWQPSPEDMAIKTTAEIETAITPVNDRLLAWAYEDTTYIDGGSIYTNSITANQIAAGAIGADQIAANAITAGKILAGAITGDKIAANAITSEKIAAGAVTADNIAAGSITSNMIAANGLDAGVIKFGTMSGSRIMTNTLDANVLKSGTVIANDIKFSGVLSGATGTFSGAVTVGSTTGSNGYLDLRNGYLESRKVSGSYEYRANLNSGGMDFYYFYNNAGNVTSLKQGPNGLEVIGNLYTNGSSFTSNSVRLAPYGEINIDTSTSSGGMRFNNSRTLYQYSNAYFYDSLYISGSGQQVSIIHSGILSLNPGSDIVIGGGEYKVMTVGRQSSFSQLAYFSGATQFTSTSSFYSTVNFYSTTNLSGTTYFNGTKIINSGEFISGISERGYCGVGGVSGGSTNIAGVGVNFRVKKNYTPSYVNLSQTSGTANGVFYTDVSNEGFFLYITKPASSSTVYYFWRGYYTA